MTKADDKTPKRPFLDAFIGVLFLALLARGAALFVAQDSFDQDPDAYMALAENLYSCDVYGSQDVPTAFRPPLYPALLRAIIPLRASAERPKQQDDRNASDDRQSLFDQRFALSRNASVALLHWALGIATALMVCAIARRAGLSARAAVFAAILVVFDPILLQQSRLVMTETLAAFFAAALVLASAAAAKRESILPSFLLGALFGLAALCRPAFLVFAALAFIALLAAALRACAQHKVKPFFKPVMLALGCAFAIAPWTLRNLKEFKRPILATTHGGYTLSLANNPELYASLRVAPFALWDPEAFHRRDEKELAQALRDAGIAPKTKEAELFQDVWRRRQGVDAMRAEPELARFAVVMRVAELWRLIPHETENGDATRAKIQRWARIGVGGFYFCEFVAALVGLAALYSRRKATRKERKEALIPATHSPILWCFLLVLSVQLPHLVYWTNMRMRAPIQVVLPIFAAFAFAGFKSVGANRAIPEE